MATDGIKIIDGDHAHDVYHTFMNLYDTGVSLEQIQTHVEQLDIGDDFDHEIFITAYALALWETGTLTEKVRQQVQQAIQAGAFAQYLTEEENQPAEGRRRQKVLERFWLKISQPSTRIRKRRNQLHQSKFVFEVGDVLTFQMPDGTYRATILLLISQSRSRCSYYFLVHTYTGAQKPTIDDVLKGKILGMTMHPSFPYRIGFNVVGIGHKHLQTSVASFERIGTVKINEAMIGLGTQAGAISFGSFMGNFQHFNHFSDSKKTAASHLGKTFPVSRIASKAASGA